MKLPSHPIVDAPGHLVGPRPRAFLRPVLGVSLALGLIVALPIPLGAQGSRAGARWVGTWATAVVARPATGGGFGPARGRGDGRGGPPAAGRGQARGRGPGPAALELRDQTLRQVVHTSLGGERARVVFSNAFGTGPLAIGAAYVAVRGQGAGIRSDSGGRLTFAGQASATIPPGAILFSDPLELSVPADGDLAIDLYLPGDVIEAVSTVTTHGGALQTNYVSETGNHAGSAALPVSSTSASWFFLARVEVAASDGSGAVVTFGDSITDGTRSTVDTNHRWPDYFADRLRAAGLSLGVLNQGIAGNRVLADGAGVSALARFDRDVLVQTGATHVVVLESINDIGFARESPSPSAADLIAGHRQLIDRAHARGLKIFGATLTPFDGAAYWAQEGEAKRQAVNTWIRTSGAYDGVIDFDAAVRNPAEPTALRPEFDPGDHLHMNDAGYEAMANAVDLALFR